MGAIGMGAIGMRGIGAGDIGAGDIGAGDIGVGDMGAGKRLYGGLFSGFRNVLRGAFRVSDIKSYFSSREGQIFHRNGVIGRIETIEQLI